MDSILVQLGVGGALTLLILREVFSFLSKKRFPSPSAPTELMESMARKLDELHVWHNVMDSDGVKIWYVRRSLEDSIAKLAEAIQNQNLILHEMASNNKDLARAIREDKI